MIWLCLVLYVGIALIIAHRLDRIQTELEAAMRDRQQMMDAIASLEAHVSYLAGAAPLTEAERVGLREAVRGQIDIRRLR